MATKGADCSDFVASKNKQKRNAGIIPTDKAGSQNCD